jgi:hypothetical protein
MEYETVSYAFVRARKPNIVALNFAFMHNSIVAVLLRFRKPQLKKIAAFRLKKKFS